MFDRILKWVLLWGLGFLIFLRPLVSGLVYPWSNTLFLIWTIFLCFVCFLRFVWAGEWFFKRTFIDWAHGVFLVGLVASWFFSVNPYEGLAYFQNFLAAILAYYLIVYSIHSEKEIVQVLRMMVIAGCVVSLYGIYQGMFGLKEAREFVQSQNLYENFSESLKIRMMSPRIFSTLIYPNVLAGFLLGLIPVVAASLWFRNKKYHAWIILSSVLAGIAIFLLFEKPQWIWLSVILSVFYPLLYLGTLVMTYSKGGLIVFIVLMNLTLVLLYGSVPSSRKRLYRWIVIFLNLVWVGLALLKVEYLQLKIWPSMKVRWEYWQAAWRMIKEHLWFGTGPGTFGSVYARYMLLGAEETRMAHNHFLQVFSEGGLITGTAFLWIWMLPLIISFKNIIKKSFASFGFPKWPMIGTFLGLSGFVLHNFMDFDFFEPAISLYGWVFLAILQIYNTVPDKVFILKTQRTSVKILVLIIGQGIAIIGILSLKNPYDAQGYFEDALRAYSRKDIPKAWTSINESIKKCSFNPQAYLLKAELLDMLGNQSEALEFFQEALKKDPYSPILPFKLASIYQEISVSDKKDFSKEIGEALRKAVENYPVNPIYHLKLGQYYEKIGRKQEALLEYEQVRRLGLESKSLLESIRRLKENL